MIAMAASTCIKTPQFILARRCRTAQVPLVENLHRDSRILPEIVQKKGTDRVASRRSHQYNDATFKDKVVSSGKPTEIRANESEKLVFYSGCVPVNHRPCCDLGAGRPPAKTARNTD